MKSVWGLKSFQPRGHKKGGTSFYSDRRGVVLPFPVLRGASGPSPQPITCPTQPSHLLPRPNQVTAGTPREAEAWGRSSPSPGEASGAAGVVGEAERMKGCRTQRGRREEGRAGTCDWRPGNSGVLAPQPPDTVSARGASAECGSGDGPPEMLPALTPTAGAPKCSPFFFFPARPAIPLVKSEPQPRVAEGGWAYPAPARPGVRPGHREVGGGGGGVDPSARATLPHRVMFIKPAVRSWPWLGLKVHQPIQPLDVF